MKKNLGDKIDSYAAGTNHTLKFWLFQGLEKVMKCEEECNKCREKNFILAEQIMAPLPKFRLKEPLHVFALTAANCGRPYIVSEERRKRRQKKYICLFTCSTTRVVHLGVGFDMDTDQFLNEFYRMVNCHELPM